MKHLLLAFALLCLPAMAQAEVPFQFAAPNLRAPDDPDVNGIRLAIFHGRNRNMRGVDFGIFALSESSALSGFSAVTGMHRLTGNMSGVAWSIVNVHSGRDTGLNAAFVNRTRALDSGANVGFINIADEHTMVDVGGINVSGKSVVQVGFVNLTKNIRGVQIGFLNFAENGFLPVFPFFNFPRNSR